MPAGPGAVRPRAAARGPRGRAAAQRRPDPRGGVRAPALRPLLHDGQHALGRRGGGVHRRRLRRPHADHVVRARTPGGGAGRRCTPEVELRLMMGDPVAAGPHLLRRVRGRVPGRAAGRGGRGLADALLVGHDRASQGDPPPADRPALRLGRHAVGDARRHHGVHRGRRLPEPGAALPLRPAGLVDDGAPPGRDRGGHGALRPRALPGAHRRAQGHARPVRPDHVRAHAQAARRRAGRPTTSPRCARWCTPPHPARPR